MPINTRSKKFKASLNKAELSVLRSWYKPKRAKKNKLTKRQKQLQRWRKKYKGYSYSRLLTTRLWKTKREKILKRDGRKCTRCGEWRDLHVHHKKYTTEFPWMEKDTNLTTLCWGCHEKKHGRILYV